MKENRYIVLDDDILQQSPVFHSFIEVLNNPIVSTRQCNLLISKKLSGYSIIEKPSKLISGILDFSKL